MSASDSVLRRTVRRATSLRNQVVCRELLHVLGVYRYTRDPSSQTHFHNSIFRGQDLYDVALSDGECRLNLALDPGLNWLVEENVLRRGAGGRNAILVPLDLPVPGESFVLTGVQVCAPPEVERGDGKDLPWITSFTAAAPIMADRKVYLPLWNNVDFFGRAWRKSPPARESVSLPRVTVRAARQGYLDGKDWALSAVRNEQMTVRVMQKSQLMYYGQANKRGPCPYRAMLEVCDHTGSVTVVLWDSACLDWYCVLKPGDIISLSNFQIKPLYQSRGQDIEIGVNTKYPQTLISILPNTAAKRVPPHAFLQSFFSSKDLKDLPHDSVCDVVGLLIFAGRPERVREGLLLMEYRWLVLVDGRSSELIRIQLFSTSQPDAHRQLVPALPVACCGLKVVRAEAGRWYLTNTPYASLHCSGVGEMDEAPVRALREWLGRKESEAFRSSPLMGGFFAYPPPPDAVEAYTRGLQGAPALLQGNEIQKEMKSLSYRERKTLCMQAMVTQVTYCPRGEEQHSLLWEDSFPPKPAPTPEHTPVPSSVTTGASGKRKSLFHSPPKRRPPATLRSPASGSAGLLFGASLELLQNGDSGEDEGPYVTCPAVLQSVPAPTLAAPCDGSFYHEGYYTMMLNALPGSQCVSAVFLPQRTQLSPPGPGHDNTWASILAHGAFSTQGPPPAPGDLVPTAQELQDKKMICVLELCGLGKDVEVILSRAFVL
ncbi:RPA-related protein RADX [Stigmatopora argus]